MTGLRRTILSFLFSLLLLSPALAQTEQSKSQASIPIVTGTASSQRVRYVAIGEIHQLRLQLFSIDGTAVYDSDFRLGNLIDWKLQDQQGQRLSDGRYLFLITVKDFSDTLTQKYGTTQIEQEQVTLEQSSLDELSPAQATTLKSNQQATLLTAIDRIGAAGLSRIATESDDGTPSLDASMLGKKSNSAKQTTSGGQNLTGTGSMNQVAKWTDDNATLGNSSITDIGGKVGIGNSGPTATLSLGAPGVNALPTGTNIWISGVGIGPSLALQNRISFGVDTNQDYGGFMGVINNDGTAPGIALSFGTRGAGFDFSGMSVRAGRVGIGNNNPTALLSVGASGVNTLPQNTQLWLTGAGGAPSPSILQNRISLGVDTNQDYGGFMGVLNANGSVDGIMTVLGTRGAGSDSPILFMRNGNLGVGTAVPQAKLDVLGDINTSTQFNISGNRVLSMTGTSGNTFGGVSAGNTFAGVGAGAAISPRDDFNSDDGVTIHIGQSNSFFGYQAGMLEQDGTDNSFFGTLAGQQNVAGYGNSFFGASAGSSIQQGAYNTMIGANANVLGPNSISNATAIGANAQVSQSNSLVLGDAVNVGIGITEPRGKLDIERATSDGGVILRLGDLGSGTTNFNFSRDGSNGALKIQGNQVGSNNIALVPASGNVGIGTSDPKARLHVAGGNLYVANPNGVIITSPNGACWLLTVSNAGALSSISIPCP